MAFWLGRLCEEFNCLPSEAYAEWQRWPVGFLEEMVEARQYADAKAIVDRSPSQLPDTPLVQLAQVIEMELVEAAQAAKRAAAEAKAAGRL